MASEKQITKISLSVHSQQRLKERGKIKNLPAMVRRTEQAYQHGKLVEYTQQGQATYLFNNLLFIFSISAEKILLITTYKADLHNGLMKIFMQRNQNIM